MSIMKNNSVMMIASLLNDTGALVNVDVKKQA